jgi:hypothetical protein
MENRKNKENQRETNQNVRTRKNLFEPVVKNLNGF